MSADEHPAAASAHTTPNNLEDLSPDWSLAVGNNVILALQSDSLFINDPKTKKDIRYCGLQVVASTASQTIPFYDILSAQISDSALILKYAKPVVKDDYTPSTLTYALDGQTPTAKAEIWVEQLLKLAYGEAQRNKRLRVLINPYGGKGYAKELYNEYAAPMFEAAGCKVDLDMTKYSGHATDIAEKLDLDAYDAILCCSGDGLPYEVLNGFAKRPNATEALAKVAVAMIPCGSGNAMAWNLFGTNSVSLSALAVIKGLRTPLDLVSITQTGSRSLSFLSQSYGIVAESDLGTDHLRWMGAARFTYGFLTRLLRQATYPCDFAFKLETDDKQEMKQRYLEYKKQKRALRPIGGGDEVIGKGLPPLKYGTVDDEVPSDWQTISTDTLGNFYAGNMAIMTAEANFFPATVPNDGLIDVVTIDGAIGRLRALSMMTAVENGGFFNYPEVEVRKVDGYRLIPRDRKDGYISVDGERIPFQPFQVEVHPGLGTVLSKSGHLYEAQGPK
ncbi:sphingosine kinase (SphK), putative [Talaromyces stipitatus ATCC 10500]|uniref:Sphingosine kinase (SphK), putative n=1 Tax=Talaromyces stipitatus (strain ATCC 10500 / CBS 375.48 / QM 6759 / NRRL 1006) TaxID=441959 RepID=B8LVM4_TALSN|nr:sphingosine kinase (SphK), putative [Talaromyces stipitatus ATCC 10500]EED24154.1 sphingosine kinase (SphK), putative [Talaromyces stipitatus ATCC 10500]